MGTCRIVYAGPAQPAGTWEAKRKIDARGHAVMPGFINAHCHSASIVFRSQTDDPPGGITLYTIGFRGEPQITAAEWHDLAHVGAVDMVKAGITTINDIYFEPDGLAKAVETTGLRAQLCDEIFDIKKENLASGDYTRYPDIGESRLRRSVDFSSRWDGQANGRITTRLGPHAVDTCAPELHREIAAEARRLRLGLHIHPAQSAREVEVVQAMYGRNSLEHLAALGVLGPETVLAHLTFASPALTACLSDDPPQAVRPSDEPVPDVLWPGVHRQGGAGVDRHRRSEDRLQRARQPLGERLLRELQRQVRRLILTVGRWLRSARNSKQPAAFCSAASSSIWAAQR